MRLPEILLLLVVFLPGSLFAQQVNLPKKKEYNTFKIEVAPKIDGILKDAVWEKIPATGSFVMYDPGDGSPAPETHATQVKIAYTDDAIYLAAVLKDDRPEKIRRQFAQRDNIPVADYFVFDVNTYNDGENQTRFVVTAAGTLADAKMTGENEDYAFNTVWDAAVSIDEDGWYVEMEIPYSALRFPEREEQVWSIQFARKIYNLNETYVWNYINKSIGKSTHYNGLLRGIEHIEPPVRLSFYPYISGEANYFDGENSTSFNAGMDLKYGISDAFTLDATLIPDFGQTAYDEVELNLGPFEQTFGENRAFFTEGTELFTKGDLFYSRRIGDQPIGFSEVQDKRLEHEEILENPEETGLLNAVKISGRTDSGLGIGFLNAITETTYAVLRDSMSGTIRELVTSPFANYNIFVLDQQFDQKSSVSIINTNVTREGHFRDGNVTGFLFDVFNRSSSFNFEGEAKMSNVNLPQGNLTGFSSTLSVSRTKGRLRYGVTHDFANQTYDINDLGLNYRNNYNNFFWNTSFGIFEPQGIFNDYSISLYGNHQRQYSPDVVVGSGIGSSFFGMTRNRFAFGGSIDFNTKFRDFFEPRREGYFILYPENYNADVWVSSDYRDRFAYDANVRYGNFPDSGNDEISFGFSPRFRISNKFLLIYSLEYLNERNRRSFVTLEPRNIIFGNRDRENLENSLQGTYNFNIREAVSLSFRNFWSSATFPEGEFFRLKESGLLAAHPFEITEDNDPNANFNIWNLDLSYQWRFAPGSEMILLYRNSVFNLDQKSYLAYSESLENLFEQPVRHNLSLRVVYYFDYNNVKNIFKS